MSFGSVAKTSAALAQLENSSINPLFEGSKLNYASEEEKSNSIEDQVSCHGKERITMMDLLCCLPSWLIEEEGDSFKIGAQLQLLSWQKFQAMVIAFCSSKEDFVKLMSYINVSQI